MADFVHLHVHSEYSLLDGLTKFDPLMNRVKELGMDAVALTDHGGMFGAIKFYNKALASGVKPIIGVETYIAKRTRFDKDPKLDNDQYHLILLAKSEKGYKNLLKMISSAYLDGFYYKPRVDFDLLKQYSEDIIALSGCLSGIGQSHWKKGEDEKAEEGMLKLYDIFGNNFYAEIQRHKSLKELDIVNPKLIAFARKHAIPLVATADSHYLKKEDAEAQEILLCIQTQKTITDPNRGLSMINEPNFYIKSPEEMKELFLDLPEAIDNTVRIAEQVDIKLDIGKLIFPKFDLPEGETPESYLRKLSYERLPNRVKHVTDDVIKRLDYEIDIIVQKGYPTYFLIVQDLINWAKTHGVRVGPGRGSAAGSLMSYALGITDLDPMVHKLPFERFLNPERASPPDIDMDFADDRRELVIEYTTQKYGADHVAQIVTFGTMESRAAVRDAGRALGYAYGDCDRIAKMIPQGAQGSHMTIEHALELSSELKQAYDTEPATKRLLDIASRLGGVARHASVHAAGVVIGDKPLVEYTPLMREAKGEKIVTQYDMYSLDLNVADGAVGLMKMDFLGLRNLTILQKACDYVKAEHNIDVDLLAVPLDDPKVYEVIASGNTTGIFQIESPGMRRLIKDLRPTVFSDISAILALYRPGPMDLIPMFIEGKHDPSTVIYLHKDLEPILKETYGVIVYQEQCLEIAVKFAGYSMGTADLLRRAIGKKKKDLMEIEKQKFIEGAKKQGYSEQEATDVFAFIEKFASYGFNKAHTAAYALITYHTAYMKAHYPHEFMAAVMSAEAAAKISGSAREEKIGDIISECKRMSIEVLPPNINKSFASFTIEKTTGGRRGIRFGFSGVKNVGDAVIEAIIRDRTENGEFGSFYDFLKRMEGERVNKRTVESLIKAGAFDQFGNRKALLLVMDQILDQIAKMRKSQHQNQVALFETAELSAQDEKIILVPSGGEDFSVTELINMEKEFLGFYFSATSMFENFPVAKAASTHTIVEIIEEGGAIDSVTILAMPVSVRRILTKASNEEMAFVKFEDESSEIEGVIFPRTYALIKELVLPNKPLLVLGKVDMRNDEQSLIVEKVVPPEMVSVIKDLQKVQASANAWRKGRDDKKAAEKKKAANELELFIKRGVTREQLELINALLKDSPGDKKVTIVLENKNTLRRIPYAKPIRVTPALQEELESILGRNCLQSL